MTSSVIRHDRVQLSLLDAAEAIDLSHLGLEIQIAATEALRPPLWAVVVLERIEFGLSSRSFSARLRKAARSSST